MASAAPSLKPDRTSEAGGGAGHAGRRQAAEADGRSRSPAYRLDQAAALTSPESGVYSPARPIGLIRVNTDRRNQNARRERQGGREDADSRCDHSPADRVRRRDRIRKDQRRGFHPVGGPRY